ncbi:MAG: recombinase family protein [Deltaproteobacteria bacterium]|nr:recombinase family protein [Deltaproteobacteria bacterium]
MMLYASATRGLAFFLANLNTQVFDKGSGKYPLKDLLNILERIEKAGAGFHSLTESVDTTTAAGRMLMQMLGSFAEFERAMIRERSRAGLEAARAQGRVGGRRPKLTDAQKLEIVAMIENGRKSAADAARLFQVHRSTICQILALNKSSLTTAQERRSL